MQERGTRRSIEAVIGELCLLVAEERCALRLLDGPRLEDCVAEKLALNAELQSYGAEVGPKHSVSLQEIRTGLRANQLLMLHARDQVLGTLALIGGRASPMVSARTAASRAVFLDTKG